MLRHVFIALALVIAVAACRREPKPPPDRPDHVLLEDLDPPPLNKPIERRPAPQQEAQVQLPPGPAAALIPVRDGRPFAGAATLTGSLTIAADRIRIDPSAGNALELLYRLPAGVPSLRAGRGDGSIEIAERSGPAGADRRVLVRLDSRLVLGEVWQRSPRPLVVELGNGLRLLQQPVRVPNAQSYTEAQLGLFDSGRMVARVALGRPTEIQTATGRYVVLAEISHLFTPSASDAGQVESGYVLRAWIVAAQ